MKLPASEKITVHRSGFLLYFVVSLLLVAAIFGFSLSTFKSGAVEQLAQTMDQNRLMVLAQAGIQEMLAHLRFQANRPGTQPPGIHKEFREIFSKINPLNAGVWPKTISFPPSLLPEANGLANMVRGANVKVEGKLVLLITGQSNTNPTSYFGQLEFYSRAIPSRTPDKVVEIKEVREVKLTDTKDFLDKYALYVKTYPMNINDRNRRIRIERTENYGTGYPWVYLGNRFYPYCKETFSSDGPPIFVDIDFPNDKILLKGIFENNPSFPFRNLPSGLDNGQNSLFFALSQPIDFKNLVAQGSYQASDFYQVDMLHQFYHKLMEEVSAKTSEEETGSAKPILEDYRRNKSDLSGSEGFKNLVETCVQKWEYHFGYTDFNHIVDKSGDFTQFANSLPFVGIQKFFEKYNNAGSRDYNPARLDGGTMPMFYGESRGKPVMIEGNVFARFFKVAFFNGIRDSFELLNGYSSSLELPPLPIFFRLPNETPVTFENKQVPNIKMIEKVLMSRAVEDVPINRFYFPKEVKPRLNPEQAGTKISGERIFPAHDTRMTSHIFYSGSEMVNNRSFPLGDDQILDIDGLMVIAKGDLDLSKVHYYRGKGQILVVSGNCKIGNFGRMDPASGDTLKIYLNNGRFEVTTTDARVKIEASLIALAGIATENRQGAFLANQKDVEIVGNLVVDLLPIKGPGTLGLGSELLIRHDEKIVFPSDPFRISVGQVSVNYAVNTGNPTW